MNMKRRERLSGCHCPVCRREESRELAGAMMRACFLLLLALLLGAACCQHARMADREARAYGRTLKMEVEPR